MSENLPPLSALRAFEAAARHLHFTRAAEELGMTQAAVSYQIKLLEERMGAPLFLRQPKELALTEAGERLAPGIIEAFALMRASVAATKSRSHQVLTVSTIQTFALYWLVHRIGSFQMLNPDIAVRIDVSSTLVDFSRDPVDVGIRQGYGDWPGLDAHAILPADFTPLMTPELAAMVREPKDLLKLTLLDRQDAWWDIWFADAGVDVPQDTAAHGLELYSQALISNLAKTGQGVAMLTPAFFQAELKRGELVQPFELMSTDGAKYYLVYPHARRNAPHIRAFRNWMLSEAQEMAA